MALSFDSVSMEVKVRNKSSTACLPWRFPGLFLQCVAWAEFPHLQGQQCLGRPAGNKGKPPDLGGWAPSVALRLLRPATPIANGCQCSPSCFLFHVENDDESADFGISCFKQNLGGICCGWSEHGSPPAACRTCRMICLFKAYWGCWPSKVWKIMRMGSKSISIGF